MTAVLAIKLMAVNAVRSWMPLGVLCWRTCFEMLGVDAVAVGADMVDLLTLFDVNTDRPKGYAVCISSDAAKIKRTVPVRIQCAGPQPATTSFLCYLRIKSLALSFGESVHCDGPFRVVRYLEGPS